MSYEEKPADNSKDVYFGIEWAESNVDGGTFTITPKIYRWDRYNTNNSGSRWSEDLTEPSGSAGSWSNLSFGSGSGYRVIDTFSKRTYSKSHNAKTIYYHLYTDSSFGTYSGAFYTLGAQTWTFLMTVPARSSYTVTLNSNGGSGGTKSLTKWYNESLSLTSGVTAPTRTGHKFAGWYENSSGTGSAATSYTGNAAKTYYAKWTPDTYTMTYKANGGSGSDQTQTKTYGVNATIKAANTFSRTGYTFDSWNTKADGTGTKYSAGGSYTGNAAVTLYAIWKINTWAVTYYGNNATGGSTSAQTKTYNQALTLRSNGFTRTNYNFVKWNTAANGSGTGYNAGATLPASVNNAVNLYAQWEIAHTSPSFTELNVKRCTENGTENVEGQYMLVNAAWTCDSAATGSGTAKVVANGVTDTVSFTGTSGSISNRVHQNSSGTKTVFPIGSSFAVTLTVTDSDGYSSTKTTVLSVAYFTMHFKKGGTGVGIGKPSTEDNLLDIAMETRLNASATVQGTTSSSVAYGSTNPRFRFSNADASQNGELVFTDYDAVHTGATLAWITDQSQSWFHTQHIQATGSITSGGTIMAGQNEHITSTAINDASVATSSNTGITNRLDYAGNGTQVGYSQIMRTSSGMYRSFAVTNPKASKTTALYLHSNDDGTQSFSANVPLGASSGGTGRAMSTANRTYWCGRALYSNNTGTTGTVTLSETAANFTFMFIGFKENDGYYDGMFVYGPNGKTVVLTTAESTVNTAVNTKWRTVSISGTSMTTVHYSDNGSASNHIYITHVIGFA